MTSEMLGCSRVPIEVEVCCRPSDYSLSSFHFQNRAYNKTLSMAQTTSLPPRFTVPPLPPHIYRRLTLIVHDDGVVLSPDNGQSVLIHWGVKGKVEPVDGNEQGELIIGGVLGIARLWDGEL